MKHGKKLRLWDGTAEKITCDTIQQFDSIAIVIVANAY